MSLNLTNTINFAQPFIQYAPLIAGLGMEPAITIASMVRNSILNPPQTWWFNRSEFTISVTQGTQDYTQTVADLGFIEKVVLFDDQGASTEVKYVHNTSPLGKLTTSLTQSQSRPNEMAVQSYNSGTGDYTFRFLGMPDAAYTATVIYQKYSTQFGPFSITSVANASGANTTYTGTFDALSFPTGGLATIVGFTTPANNGTFVVVSCSATSLVVANASGAAQSGTTLTFAVNLSWAPLPDDFSDIYNNLFLSEALVLAGNPLSAHYRQRGVAAYLSKAAGFSETQKNIFIQHWSARTAETMSNTLGTQQSIQMRAV